MIVLGISAFYHDSAASLVKDGEVIAAAQQERFSRQKGDARFPREAVAYCLDATGLVLEDVDYVGFYDKPLLTFDRLLETHVSFAPRGLHSFARSMPLWVKRKLLLGNLVRRELNRLERGTIAAEKILFGFHHHSHAASAFFPSPFNSAAVLVMDGVGEWATTSLARGCGDELELSHEIRFPHSLGMLYSAFTYYLGFKVNEDEYKVMGLAPYGEPVHAQQIYDNLIDVKDDGSFQLDVRYFDYCVGLTMTNARFDALFDRVPPRRPAEPLTKRHMDLARSLQTVTEDVVLRLCRTLHRQTGERNLCMAGGVALNCVANGRVLREGPFQNVWIQPAAGDAGGAIGVALAISHVEGQKRPPLNGRPDRMAGAFLGPAFGPDDVHAELDRFGAVFHDLQDDALIEKVVSALVAENVVGWFQGRMEFGPRALGNRSILADPRPADMQRRLNMRIKYRESFRPFAPAVLREYVSDYFELSCDSPYMQLVSPVRPERRRDLSSEEQSRQGFDKLGVARSEISAVTHVDYTARIQTVDRRTNPRFQRLLEAFRERTGCPVLVNTSFNLFGEPIVCTPEDAYRCFMGSEMDMLVLGNTVLYKREQR